MPLRIEDYALIGNTYTAALVGRDGSIDWLCMPRFDSGACFAGLLGGPEQGRWLLAPEALAQRPTSAGESTVGGESKARAVRRSYRRDTLILETEFELEDGARVALIDFMPILDREDRVDLVRIVEGRRGTVPMRMEAAFRFDYGRIVPWVRRRDYGLSAIAGPDAIELRTPVEMHGENFTTVASFSVGEGERIPFTLTWYPSHRPEPDERSATQMLDETETSWREWSALCTVTGPWREQVMRSLITLKALTYSPTGGMVAAPTTSLPEKIGGVRNWDYRYCWLRDATFTLYSLLTSGYTEEAIAWGEWLLRAVAGSPQELQIMYGLAGERRLTELELPWLPGYERSAPVRAGNAAHDQFQLDVYGEVMDVLHVARRHSVILRDDAWPMQQILMEFHQDLLHGPRVVSQNDGVAAGDVQHVHDFTVNVELELVMSGVAGADRRAALVTGQPRQLEFRQPPLSREPIHDLELLGTPRDRAQEPFTPRNRFFRIARG